LNKDTTIAISMAMSISIFFIEANGLGIFGFPIPAFCYNLLLRRRIFTSVRAKTQIIALKSVSLQKILSNEQRQS
jgi:hypothetical protein